MPDLGGTHTEAPLGSAGRRIKAEKGEQWWLVPHMAVRDLGSLSLVGSMDFKPLSLLCQGSALAMRLQICQWLKEKKKNQKKPQQMKEAERNKREKQFIE